MAQTLHRHAAVQALRAEVVCKARATNKENKRGGDRPVEDDPLFAERGDGAICPVPRDQQPINEYNSLSSSNFFSWAQKEPREFALRLGILGCGVFAFLGWPVASLSFDPTEDPLKVAVGALAAALLSVTVAVVRLYMGWQYVGDRLANAAVEYEESGWYDGQTWIKTPEVIARDRLLGTYRVKPTLRRLKSVLTGLGVSLASCSLLLLSFSSNTHQDSEFQQVVRAFILVPALFIRLPSAGSDEQASLDPSPTRKYLLAGAVALATIAAVYLYSAPPLVEDDQRDDGRVGIQPWSRYYSEFVAAPGSYSDDDARRFEPPGTFDDVKTVPEGGVGTPGAVVTSRNGERDGNGGPLGGSQEEQRTGGLPDYCR